MGRCSSNCRGRCTDPFRWSDRYAALIEAAFGPATCRLAYNNEIKRAGAYLLSLAGVPAWSAAASAWARCTDVILDGGYEYGEFTSKERRGRYVLGFFPIFLAPAGFIFTDVAPLDLLVTRHLGFPPFRSRFLRRRHSFRWCSGLFLTPAAGRPLLRSGVGHFGWVVWVVWVMVVVVGCRCGGWMSLW